MEWKPYAIASLVPVAVISVPALAAAKIYISTEQAQQAIFPGQKLTARPVFLTDEQKAKMTELSSVREPFKGERVWRTDKGDWFIVDEVVGKHEMVKYALGINADGTIKQIEVMEYVESYGYEVGEAAWTQQFVGKTSASTLKLNQDIKNISGATLSAKHLTDGVKRLMVMYDLVLKGSK